MSDVYVDNGYGDRDDYLNCIADNYDMEYSQVAMLAELLGENEDFDGLINTLEDYYEMM